MTATALPAGVPSIANWTVPVAAAGVTVAVNVTEAPNGAGFRLDVSAVLEFGGRRCVDLLGEGRRARVEVRACRNRRQ